MVALPGATAAQGPFETPPVLQAADLVEPGKLRGEFYAVQDAVQTHGFLFQFVIDSAYGTFEARGPGMLDIRLGEIHALHELEAIRKSDVFVEALQSEAVKKASALKQAAQHPRETLEGLPEGVGRFFGRVKRAGVTGAQKVQDRVSEQQASGESFGTDEATEVAGQAAHVTADVLGMDEQRRKLAKELRVDPYTTNELLSSRLDEVASVAFAGSVGLRIGFAQIPGSMVVSATQTATQWVWDKPPGDLRVAIDEGLRSLGAPQASIDALLRHPAYTLTLQATLFDALRSVSGVSGHLGLLDWALAARTEDEARFVVLAVRMLGRYHEEVAPVADVHAPGPLTARRHDGGLVVLAPADYVSWTRRISEFATSFPDVPSREVWLSGRVSPLCRKNLAAAGWALHEGELVPRITKPQ